MICEAVYLEHRQLEVTPFRLQTNAQKIPCPNEIQVPVVCQSCLQQLGKMMDLDYHSTVPEGDWVIFAPHFSNLLRVVAPSVFCLVYNDPRKSSLAYSFGSLWAPFPRHLW